jgi:hypothetical protein
MGWSDIWEGMENAVGFGGDESGQNVGGVNPIAPNDPALQVGVSAEDIAAIDGAAPAQQTGASNSAWWEKPIKQMMPQIMGASLHPKTAPRAPGAPGGHGVQTNTSGLLKTVDEIGKAANNNPLDDLHSWAGLFK